MKKVIYFAGGCFWGVQKYFDQFEGVLETVVGYANGHSQHPTYQEVKSQKSGHSETVKVIYESDRISLKQLLDYYYRIIDPTSLNKQGEDEGISYRTGIYYVDKEDLDIIKNEKERRQQFYEIPIVVEILPLDHFYEGEEYHQKYLEKNPTGYCHIPFHMFSIRENEK